MTTTVICPQCSRPAEVDPGEHPFCRQCDYPLFWVAPRPQPVAVPEAVQRPPSGPVCVVCRAHNEPDRSLCVQCGQPLAVVIPRRRRTWEVAEPEAVPERRLRRFLTRAVLGLLMVALLALLLFAGWYFLWPRSEWQIQVLDQGEASWDISATLSRGIPVISYVDASDHTLRVVVCGNALCDAEQAAATYTTVTTLGDRGEGYGSAVAVGADGRPVIAFRDGARRTLHVAHCGDPRCDDPGAIAIAEVDPGPGVPGVGIPGVAVDNGAWPSIAIGADGFPIIAYHDAARGALKIAHCEDSGCSTATIAILDRRGTSASGPGVGTDTDIAIGRDGLPVVAFRDAEAQSLRIARCSDERCTQAVLSTVVHGPGLDPGHGISMRLAPDGSPMLAYAEWSAGESGIYYAKCGSPVCEIASVHQVDHPGDGESADPALGLDEDGLPVIAFRQRTPGDERASRILKVVRCEDLECREARDPIIVDDHGRTGYSSRLLRLSDGTIAIAYGDATEGALEYAVYR